LKIYHNVMDITWSPGRFFQTCSPKFGTKLCSFTSASLLLINFHKTWTLRMFLNTSQTPHLHVIPFTKLFSNVEPKVYVRTSASTSSPAAKADLLLSQTLPIFPACSSRSLLSPLSTPCPAILFLLLPLPSSLDRPHLRSFLI
jgi:hypothetical protein